MNYGLNQTNHQWFPNNPKSQSCDDDVTETFRVLNYNILSPTLLKQTTGKDESYIRKSQYLNWDNRLNRIMNEIQTIAPDIICFEEYENDYQLTKALIHQGFDIAFKLRMGNNKDGCAILWKSSLFGIENIFSINFKLNFDSKCDSNKDEENIYSKDHIALFTMLKIKTSNELLLVVSSHLLFNPKRGEIKLGQIHQIINSIHQIKNIYQRKKLKIVFGCDLNSTPCSAVYDYITQGEIDLNGLDRFSLSGQRVCHRKEYKTTHSMLHLLNKKATYCYTNETRHNNIKNHDAEDRDNINWYNQISSHTIIYDKQKQLLQLSFENKPKKRIENSNKLILKSNQIFDSAYHTLYQQALDDYNSNENLIKDNGMFLNKKRKCESDLLISFTFEPIATFYSNQLIGTFDYIFHSNQLVPVKALCPPSLKYLNTLKTNLPNRNHPSDHFPIAVDFLL